ncbi:SdpA family antimicrobial peptide system protein [Nocardiopsis ganjiahuensis]|uniref:SdpA family antimicrobial peptide system protein n=1 Tax=Nocardiopsis ganjiahuensis TaxID=239984 RepID=UPI0003614546|nr:SdpA family antimicrobial peptide system protein [Nocardiopsis ganjiahuensis]
MEKDDDGGHRGAGASVTLTLVILVLAGSIFYALPSNTLSVRDGGTVRTLFARTMPQNWAFFTKPPNDPELVPYTADGDGSVDFASTMPNGSAENLYGLTRTQRAQGPEIANMANRIEEWTDCGSLNGDCLSEVASGTPVQWVENTSPVPTLCGKVIIARTEPVPWPYRDKYRGWRIDDEMALIEARCR